MRNNFRRLYIFTIAALLSFSSCIPLRDYVYLQEDDLEKIKIEVAEHKPYRIQSNDNLYIQVISNDDLSIYFNLSSTDRYLNNDAAIEISSYKVDNDGNIEFPHVGTIQVAGLTTQEIQTIISQGISELLVQYSVVVKLVNRSVSLLGEFNNPGTYTFYKDRMTIFEALGLGKDLTDFGNRKNVKVIRNSNNEKTITSLDLTTVDVFASEYYYILPNDIIYVEPTNRIYGAKTLPFTAILTSVNTAVLLYNVISNAVRD